MSQHAHDSACVFCKIIRGEIPSARVLETDHAVAFLDINPVIQGHVLLVPKAHHSTLADLPDDLAAEAARLVPRLARAIRQATGADGLNLIVNNGLAAGQTVDHGHWHLIPRFIDDPVDWPWPHDDYSGDGLNHMKEQIRGILAAEPQKIKVF